MGYQRATKHRQLHGSYNLSTPWGKNMTMKSVTPLGDQLLPAPWDYTKIVIGVIPMVVTFPSSPWAVRGRQNIVNFMGHTFCQPHVVKTWPWKVSPPWVTNCFQPHGNIPKSLKVSSPWLSHFHHPHGLSEGEKTSSTARLTYFVNPMGSEHDFKIMSPHWWQILSTPLFRKWPLITIKSMGYNFVNTVGFLSNISATLPVHVFMVSSCVNPLGLEQPYKKEWHHMGCQIFQPLKSESNDKCRQPLVLCILVNHVSLSGSVNHTGYRDLFSGVRKINRNTQRFLLSISIVSYFAMQEEDLTS